MINIIKKISVDVEGPTEKRLIEILGRVWQKSTAKMIVYLLYAKEATPADVERHMDMRQPEVSNATQALLKENLISIKQIKVDFKKGRPKYLIKLTKTPKDLLMFIERKMQREIVQIEKDLDSLKELIDSGKQWRQDT